MTLTLQVERGADPICGVVFDDVGAPHAFAGLVELVLVLRELGLPVDAQSPPGPARSSASRS